MERKKKSNLSIDKHLIPRLLFGCERNNISHYLRVIVSPGNSHEKAPAVMIFKNSGHRCDGSKWQGMVSLVETHQVPMPTQFPFIFVISINVKEEIYDLEAKQTCSLPSCNDPFGSPLDEFLKKDAQVWEHESTNVKCEKFSSMPRAKFQSNLRFVGMAQPGVFHLPRNLVYSDKN